LKRTATRSDARIDSIKRRIARLDRICAGTLLERTKVCGKPNCRCAADPDARHGPYFEWNRWKDDALRHRLVSADEARLVRRAQDNYQTLLQLLAEWEDESATAILGAERLTRRPVRR
jgi:hypothetical protein